MTAFRAAILILVLTAAVAWIGSGVVGFVAEAKAKPITCQLSTVATADCDDVVANYTP